MSQLEKKYTFLRLNGIDYSRLELLSLVDLKSKKSHIPDWEKEIFYFIGEWLDEKDAVSVKTSGSTGKPKNIQIEKRKMIASAQATNSFFGLDENKKALLCLPAEYIAGKMMLVRAFVGGFDLHYVEPTSDALQKVDDDFDFSAIVPLQLESVLKSENARNINRVKKMIVGGAAVRQDLIQSLSLIRTQVWATYGMTETITHIALQGLNGKHKADYYQGLPHIKFEIDERSCLRIIAPHLSEKPIQTNDRVELLSPQQFRFLGRADFVINSGGIKFSPEVLEQKLESFMERNFAFSSKKDSLLGQKLILVIEGEAYSDEKIKNLTKKLKTVLSRLEQPKEIVFIHELPKTNNAKLDRLHLKEIII